MDWHKDWEVSPVQSCSHATRMEFILKFNITHTLSHGTLHVTCGVGVGVHNSGALK